MNGTLIVSIILTGFILWTSYTTALSCDSCGQECTAACGSRHFRACCFNYLRKRSDSGHRYRPPLELNENSMEDDVHSYKDSIIVIPGVHFNEMLFQKSRNNFPSRQFFSNNEFEPAVIQILRNSHSIYGDDSHVIDLPKKLASKTQFGQNNGVMKRDFNKSSQISSVDDIGDNKTDDSKLIYDMA